MSYRAVLLAAVFLLCGPGLIRAADPPLPAGAVLRLGDSRFRAGGPVTDLLFSTDSSELVSRGPAAGGTVRVTVWDVATGRPIRTTTGPVRPETHIRWGTTTIPDGPRGVVIDPDGFPVIRDFETGKDLARLTGHFARVTAVTVSPDGKRIATASADGLIRVWDTESARPVDDLGGHSAAVRGVTVSPDGRLAATTGADRTVRLWDLATGRERRAFASDGEGIATFTPDGVGIRISGAEGIIVRDIVTGSRITQTANPPADPFAGLTWLLRLAGVSVALSPDGRTIAIGTRAGTVSLYERATGGLRRRYPCAATPCRDLAFTPDGHRLLVAGSDHAVLVWSARLRDVPIPATLRQETRAAWLWDQMTEADAGAAYLAMARLAVEPAAAVKMVRLRVTAGATYGPVGDARAVELLEMIGTTDARLLLRELAEDPNVAGRSREASESLLRLGDVPSPRGDVRTTSGTSP
jgi:WD40 repeat protein